MPNAPQKSSKKRAKKESVDFGASPLSVTSKDGIEKRGAWRPDGGGARDQTGKADAESVIDIPGGWCLSVLLML